MRSGTNGKLIPWYIGPFEILEGVDETAYMRALPLNLSGVHLVFYMSMIRMYHE